MCWDIAGYGLKWCSGIISNRTLLEDEEEKEEGMWDFHIYFTDDMTTYVMSLMEPRHQRVKDMTCCWGWGTGSWQRRILKK
jgi:hypothetical protein